MSQNRLFWWGGKKKSLSNFISKIIKIMDFGKCFALLDWNSNSVRIYSNQIEGSRPNMCSFIARLKAYLGISRQGFFSFFQNFSSSQSKQTKQSEPLGCQIAKRPKGSLEWAKTKHRAPTQIGQKLESDILTRQMEYFTHPQIIYVCWFFAKGDATLEQLERWSDKFFATSDSKTEGESRIWMKRIQEPSDC